MPSAKMESTWDDLCPDGAFRFYEGDDPSGFRVEMIFGFGFDPAADAESWNEAAGWKFFIPAGLVEAVYGDERYPLGS